MRLIGGFVRMIIAMVVYLALLFIFVRVDLIKKA